MMHWPDSRIRLPGFRRNLVFSTGFLGVMVLLPLATLVVKAGELGWPYYWHMITDRRAVATYRLTFTSAAVATVFNIVFGLLMAWILVRYRFPGRRLVDGLIDLPFALPTSVSGLTLAALFAPNGWFGSLLAGWGIQVAYAPPGVAVAMAFTSLPFVVRSVQPVLMNLEPEVEEAAESLGASPPSVFWRIIMPSILPALATGATLAFARSLGEYGAIVFISGNLPYRTEITSLLAYIRLDEFDYSGSAALSTVLLGAAALVILSVNGLQRWNRRHQ
jgi:sulfate transport system permease protein